MSTENYIDKSGLYFGGVKKIDPNFTYVSVEGGGGTGGTVDTSNLVDLSSNQDICGNKVFKETVTFDEQIVGDLSGNAVTVTDGVYLSTPQTITGIKTFTKNMIGDISGNAETVTNGVYTTGDQDICGNKTFKETVTFVEPIEGDVTGVAAFVINGVYTIGDQDICGNKTFKETVTFVEPIVGSVTGSSGLCTGNAETVTDGVYINGDQDITGIKTFTKNIIGDISGNVTGSSGLCTGNAETVTDGVYINGDQTITGKKTFNEVVITGDLTITDDISGTHIEIGKQIGDINPLTRFGRGTGGGSSLTKTAFGHGALSNDDGLYNTAVGRYALQHLVTGNFNTGIGEYAGYQGGDIIFKYGSHNTFLGKRTSVDNSGNTYNNSTAVGAGAIIDASNQIVLGTANETVKIPGDLNVVGDISGNAATVTDGVYLSTDQTITGKKTFDDVDITGDISGTHIEIRKVGSGYGEANPTTRFGRGTGGGTSVSKTAFGWGALNNDNGVWNVGFGNKALPGLQTGDRNTGIGAYAGYQGGDKVFIDGSNNTFIGSGTSVDNSGNTYNHSTAVGVGATIDASNQIVLGTVNETVKIPGDLNVVGDILGNAATVTDGVYLSTDQTITGKKTFDDIDITGDLTITGDITGDISGTYIHAGALSLTRFGKSAGGGTSTQMTAIGQRVLQSTSGNWNTAVGSHNFSGSVTGNYNVSIGMYIEHSANGQNTIGGSYNTYIGSHSGPQRYFTDVCGNTYSDFTATYNRSTAIGYNAKVDASNQIVLGTAGETVKIPGNLTVQDTEVTSDDRLKHNETDISNALHNIRQLHPKHYIKTYEMYDADHSFPLDICGQPIDVSGNVVRHVIEEGFIAQDLIHIDSFKPFVYAPVNDSNPYSVNYNSIFVHSVKALQELDAEHTQTKAELASTKETLIQTETILQSALSRITALEQAMTSSSNTFTTNNM